MILTFVVVFVASAIFAVAVHLPLPGSDMSLVDLVDEFFSR